MTAPPNVVSPWYTGFRTPGECGCTGGPAADAPPNVSYPWFTGFRDPGGCPCSGDAPTTDIVVDWQQDFTNFQMWTGTSSAFTTQIDTLQGNDPGAYVVATLDIPGANTFTDFAYESSSVAFWTPLTPVSVAPNQVVLRGVGTLDLQAGGSQQWANFQLMPPAGFPDGTTGTLTLQLFAANGALIETIHSGVVVNTSG